MNVVVSRDLTGLKTYLIEKGHNVYDENENMPADAYIYKGGNFYNGSYTENSAGCLIINGEGKSFLEIENILNKRIYSSLF